MEGGAGNRDLLGGSRLCFMDVVVNILDAAHTATTAKHALARQQRQRGVFHISDAPMSATAIFLVTSGLATATSTAS